ncbi:hypothetical protein P22_3405 [Propionispora sp. 2/2-37]|uniref:nucleoside triphosphate hydrolase n=1 Tax=Propionispora sp. 2/2-37 TaxID=1677858 RepID=UPI0006BB84A0|nr:nucleoside triphosphate hydrolase [Propionispora sp. 2/2-37]CUH97278.1 hypothetical protein P22_3405 [Propionispora sp. 2/2-37]
MDRFHNVNLRFLTGMLLKTYHRNPGKRFLLGLTGIPGAGKSTIAGKLMNSVNRACSQDLAIVVPMDGFHLTNDSLIERNLLARKGIPETFDALGFIGLLQRIVLDGESEIGCPAYDRRIHNPVANAILVEKKHRIVIVEGNYLLLDREPWNQLEGLFDETWFIDARLPVIQQRLVKRHLRSGRTQEEAAKKVSSTDMPNAKLILRTRDRADKVIRVQEW